MFVKENPHRKKIETVRGPASQTLPKALNISSSTKQAALDLLKALTILSDITVRRSAFHQEDLEPYWKLQKRPCGGD